MDDHHVGVESVTTLSGEKHVTVYFEVPVLFADPEDGATKAAFGALAEQLGVYLGGLFVYPEKMAKGGKLLEAKILEAAQEMDALEI